MTSIVPFPPVILTAESCQISAPVPSQNTSITGIPSANRIAVGRFMLSASVEIWRPNDYLEWQAFVSATKGITNIFPFRLPVRRRTPLEVANEYAFQETKVTFSDGTLFDDGEGFGLNEVAGRVSQDVPRGSTSMFVQLSEDVPLAKGMPFFSFSLHEITRAVKRAPGQWEITFTPPLSRVHRKTQTIDFANPFGFFQLESQDGAFMDANSHIYTTVSFTAREASPTTIAKAMGVSL